MSICKDVHAPCAQIVIACLGIILLKRFYYLRGAGEDHGLGHRADSQRSTRFTWEFEEWALEVSIASLPSNSNDISALDR